MSHDTAETIVKQLVAEAKRTYEARAYLATVIFAYVVIDSMAYAALSSDRTQVQAADFKAWVDRYMQAVGPNEYQYNGEELYAARCGPVAHDSSCESGKLETHRLR